jgi:CubicO group peptidase (beta-lactamase class C family)
VRILSVRKSRRPLGRFFQEEIAAPLGIEFYIGLPPEVPDGRVANLVIPVSPLPLLPAIFKLPRDFRRSVLNPESMFSRSVNIPLARSRRLPDGWHENDRSSRSVEQPSGNGIGQVRAIARAYSEFATGGRTLRLDATTLELLSAEPLTPPAGAKDEVMCFDAWYGLGFERPSPKLNFGTSRRSFGHHGTGGSFGFADPDRRAAFAYAPLKLGFEFPDETRETALRFAADRCIDRLGQ